MMDIILAAVWIILTAGVFVIVAGAFYLIYKNARHEPAPQVETSLHRPGDL